MGKIAWGDDAFSARADPGFGGVRCAGFIFAGRPAARDLHAAGYWTILLSALGSVPAVASGLLMTKGGVLGHGALRFHHVFVWPAFGLIVALATWRVTVGQQATRGMLTIYLLVVGTTAGLITAAGYWGGEMMLAG